MERLDNIDRKANGNDIVQRVRDIVHDGDRASIINGLTRLVGEGTTPAKRAHARKLMEVWDDKERDEKPRERETIDGMAR